MQNSRHVSIHRANNASTHATLDQYLNRKRIRQMPWAAVQSIAVSNAQFKLINSTTHLPAGLLAVLTANPPATLTTNAGICAAQLAGAIGNAAVTNYTDNLGNILNLVPIRDSITHEEIQINVAGTSRTVFGLIQCAAGVGEGVAVGASASENTQISFVYIAADGTITLTAITATIDFIINKAFIDSQQPDVVMEGGSPEEVVVEPAVFVPINIKYIVTAQYANGEVIAIATGAGAGSGIATRSVVPSGAAIAFPSTEAEFNANNLIKCFLNGARLIRGVEVQWKSSTTIAINYVLDIGDVFELEIPVL